MKAVSDFGRIYEIGRLSTTSIPSAVLLNYYNAASGGKQNPLIPLAWLCLRKRAPPEWHASGLPAKALPARDPR
eukprot:2905113-Amphidinium_carterae.1